MLLLEAHSRGAVWVIVGEVGGSSVLRVLQTHAQPPDADSSVHLVEEKRGSRPDPTKPSRVSTQTSAREIQI